MHLLISILGAVLIIFIIIILHEMGHFFVARMFGIRILKFSIGFGKALYTKKDKKGTEYVLAAVPLGGYVKMFGENTDGEQIPKDQHRYSYDHKPLLVRMAVVLAGPVTNFILAALVFWVVYLVGVDHVKPIVGKVTPISFAAKAGIQPGDHIQQIGDKKTHNWQQVVLALFVHMGNSEKVQMQVIPKQANTEVTRQFDLSQWNMDKRKPEIFKSLGMFPYFPKVMPVVAEVVPQSPAAKAGIKHGDVIKSINGKSVTSWRQVIKDVGALGGKKIPIQVMRNNQTIPLNLTVGKKKSGRGFLGVMVKPPKYPSSMIYKERYNVLTAWQPALVKTWTMIKYNAIVLYKMITAKLSFKTMGGPISIFQAAGQATQAGIEVYLNFLGFISLTVGFINLLPIPGLDGGHFLYQLVEAVIRRPIPIKIQQYGFTLGIMFVIFVVLHATVNDLLRIFG